MTCWATGLSFGCASSRTGAAEVVTGARAEVTEDGLHRMRNAGFKNAWAKPSVDFRAYDKLGLELVEIRYKREPSRSHSRITTGTRSNFALSQNQIDRMQRYFREIFGAELAESSSFALVDAPGPDVLHIQASIIDLVVKVPPATVPARDRVYATSTAHMTLMLEVYDSESGEILARLTDRKEARQPGRAGPNDLYWSNAVSESDSVRLLFRRWARILRDRLDRIHQVGPGQAPAG